MKLDRITLAWQRLSLLSIMIALFLICACAPQAIVYRPLTLPKAPQKTQDVLETVEKKQPPPYEEIQTPVFARPPAKPAAVTPEKKTPAKEIFDYKRIVFAQNPVIINAANMPLSDFIIYALGETMKIVFVMDDKVMNNKQPVTLRMPDAMPAAKAMEIVLGMLEKHGVYLEEKAGALYILSKPPQQPLPPTPEPYPIQFGHNVSDSPTEILQIVPLKYYTAMELKALLEEITRTTVRIKAYPTGNIMMMYGRPDEIRKVMDVVETFDIPYLVNKKTFLLHFTYIKAEDFINEMKTILTGLGYRIAASANDPGPLFMHIKQLRAALVVSPDDKTSRLILEWKSKLDAADSASAGVEERAFSFRPQYARASELVKSIQMLYGIAPSAAGVSRPIQGVTATGQGIAAPGQGYSPQMGTVQGGTGILLPGMRISADDNRNIIIFIGTPSSYKVVYDLLTNIDTPPRQVLIEASIIELTLTDELKYGVEWFLKNSQSGGSYNLGTMGRLGLTQLGLVYNFISDTANIQALISAMATQNRANILSTPRLMVLDNKEASIQVGSDIPTVTGQVTSAAIPSSTTQPGILQNITYRNTGVMMRIRPTINTEGLLTLDIAQEVSQSGAPGAGGSPVILTRQITTTVIVGHGQTVALGGLMKENEGLVETKVPILGDIPFIGHLFKYTSKVKEKTELLVLVTPSILSTTDEAEKITGELRKELKWLK